MAALCWSSREEIPHAQGKRNPCKMVGVAREHQGKHTETRSEERRVGKEWSFHSVIWKGAVAARAQEGLEELSHIDNQEGWR